MTNSVETSGAPTPARRGWWSRNWKWAVPVGCLLPVLACGGFFTFLMVFVFGMMKSSEPYRHAISAAESNPAVVSLLGTPIKPGFMASGNIHINDGSGDADLSIPVSGPKGSGTIHVVATKSGGQWTYSTLTFTPMGGGTPIDLLGSSP